MSSKCVKNILNKTDLFRNVCFLVLSLHVGDEAVRVLADEEGLVIAGSVVPLYAILVCVNLEKKTNVLI